MTTALFAEVVRGGVEQLQKATQEGFPKPLSPDLLRELLGISEFFSDLTERLWATDKRFLGIGGESQRLASYLARSKPVAEQTLAVYQLAMEIILDAGPQCDDVEAGVRQLGRLQDRGQEILRWYTDILAGLTKPFPDIDVSRLPAPPTGPDDPGYIDIEKAQRELSGG
jgi:hypothetical protein